MNCPVCCEKELEITYDICKVCGWERTNFIPTETFYVLDIEPGPNSTPDIDTAQKAWAKWGTWGWFLTDKAPTNWALERHKAMKNNQKLQEGDNV